MRDTAFVVLLAAAVVLATGCEDSEVTAPTDGIINLSVNPSTIVIDPNAGQTSGDAQVIAAVFDNDGKALQNVSVLFSTGGGTLASAGTAVKTNASGLAIDTLTVTTTSPATFKVTAQSSAIIQTADVVREIVASNEPPLASILETPAGSGQVGQVITFDGSTSVDPDGAITCYQWVVDSDVNTSDEVVQGPTTSALQRTYGVEQQLVVLLRVSDRADAGTLCDPAAAPVPADLFSPKIDTLQYPIVCANTPPLANAGPDQTVFIPPNTTPTAQVLLDGTRSSDPDGIIVRYSWNCGNGVPPFTTGLPPGQAFCTYRALGDYVATLTVFDDGDGTVQGGTYRCQKFTEDQTTVRIVQQGSTTP